MSSDSAFWQLQHLSNQQLLDSLGQVLRNQRRNLAELIAHLVEVEERRLQLEAAHGSLFDYCVRRLQMSEDEACRRIDLARLARRFPALFPLLASGDLTLSAALVLKPVLTGDNHLELLAAARRKSTQETRELLAARFPRADVPSTMRKLPEAKAAPASAPRPQPVAPLFAAPTPSAASCNSRVDAAAASVPDAVPQPDSSPPVPPSSVPACSRPAPSQHRIEPLAAQRYRLQLTIDATIKSQLETARDLLRHANPGGDLASVLSRALELLIADLLRHRFGVSTRREATRQRTTSRQKVHASASPPSASPPSASPPASARHVRHATRRTVLERDGLACTWVDANGTRCNSRAWLELDHRHPRGQSGSSDVNNIRILCRAHNQLAAERCYGRAHLERAKAKRRASQRTTPHEQHRCPAGEP